MNAFPPINNAHPDYSDQPGGGVAFRVNGNPAPQGSKKGFSPVGSTRVMMVESSENVKPWRAAVVNAAVDAMNGRLPLAGPVTVMVTFRLAKPRTVTRDLPSVRPDLDKLTRSTCDALTTAQVIYDDSQICDLWVSKRYGIPGADITVICTPDTREAAA